MTNNPAQHSPARIAGIDGLRAISILLVLIAHAWPTMPLTTDLDGVAPYLANSYLGVTTFFVISGYLITYLLRRETEKTGTISLSAFYLRRILRIFPAFYTFLIAVTLIRTIGWINTSYGDIATAATFLTNYGHVFGIQSNEDYWYVGHFWTLSLEEQFYLFWPVTMLYFGIVRSPRVAMLIIMASPILRVATYYAWPSARGQVMMMLHTATDPIMFGCLAALWQGQPWFENLLARFKSWIWPLLAGLFLLVPSTYLQTRFGGLYMLPIGISVMSLAIAFLMLWIVRHPTSSLTRFLCTPVLRHLGVLSYSLYLWQQLFLTPLNTSLTGMFPFNILACFAAAEASYWLIESPFLRLRNRVGKAPAPAPAPPSAKGGVVEGATSLLS